MRKHIYTSLLALSAGVLIMAGWSCGTSEVVRPEEIKSMRLVVYDRSTYQELATLWEEYLKAYPSEFAYGNWVYAERYAGNDFIPLVKQGLKKYPSNPLLLYLASMEKHGARDNVQALEYLEKAVAIDPNFPDPWFSLSTIYMSMGDDEKTDMALRKILESGYVYDDLLDYNYNVLLGLDSNAVLITNGDNDTFPTWILQRLLKFRSDVTIANMSLLNTEWYPDYLVARGAPRFVTPDELKEIRAQVNEQLYAGKDKGVPSGPYARPLLERLINAAERENRPLYFALTLYEDDFISSYKEKGRLLGLATLITPTDQQQSEQTEKALRIWTREFRTGGVDGWRLRHAKEPDAGRKLLPNYAFVAAHSAKTLEEVSPELKNEIFQWYRDHVEALLSEDMKKKVCQVWCTIDDSPVITEWCKVQGCRM